jgi:hypothetical protein
MPLVDPAVDDPDLHSLARGLETGTPQRGRADLLRRPVELWAVSRRAEHVTYARHASEPRQLGAGKGDREAVRDEAVAPANACPRKPLRKLASKCALLGVDPRRGTGRQGKRRGRKRDHDLGTVSSGWCEERSFARAQSEDG